jgi:cytochrome c biogenesis protein
VAFQVKPLRKLTGILTSVRVSIILIAYLTVTAILATLVPQGQDAEFYLSRYSGFAARIILLTDFSRFFSSLLFLIPSILFFINLSACTIKRLTGELRKTENRRFGPVLLHVGLMVLVVGAVVSYTSRRDGMVYLAVGEQVEMPGNRILMLLDFTFETYPDNRPKAWTSQIRVIRDGKNEIGEYSLQVNKPLRVGRTKLYQSSYGSEQVVEVRDAAERKSVLHIGETAQSGGDRIQYMGYDDKLGKAALRTGSGEKSEVVLAGIGESAGAFEVIGLLSRDTSGIQAVEDVGYPYVLAGLLIVGAGIFLTFYRKLGELK